jgi:hypothetical protein
MSRKNSSLRGPHEAPTAQVNDLISGLSTRDSSLQISSYPKQEHLAVPGLLSDRQKVEAYICTAECFIFRGNSRDLPSLAARKLDCNSYSL